MELRGGATCRTARARPPPSAILSPTEAHTPRRANRRLRSIDKQAVADLSKRFADPWKALGGPKLCETIQYGTQRAASYRITSERDVCKYIDLMIFYGRDFDQDTNLPWAQNILQNKNIRNPSSKIERLYKAAEKQENKQQPRSKT